MNTLHHKHVKPPMSDSGQRVSGGGVTVIALGEGVTSVEHALEHALSAEDSTSEPVRIVVGGAAAIPTFAAKGIERHSELVRLANAGAEEALIDVDGVPTLVPILTAIDHVSTWTLASLGGKEHEHDYAEANILLMIARSALCERV